MVPIPDDVLLIIFSVYIHNLGKSPVPLLRVSRHWYLLALAMPSFWTRIRINIGHLSFASALEDRVRWDGLIRNQDIPGDVGSTALSQYLARSIPFESSDGFPLDIEISFPLNTLTSVATRANRSRFKRCTCFIFRSYQTRLYEALFNLAAPPSAKGGTSFSDQWDITRWRTLVITSEESTCERHGRFKYCLEPLGWAGFTEIPYLQTIVLRNVGITWDTKISTPALSSLEIFKSNLEPFPNMKTIQALHITSGASEATHIPWDYCINLHTLTIDPWDFGRRPPFHLLPKLSNLILGRNVDASLFRALHRSFNTSHPLISLSLTVNFIFDAIIYAKGYHRLGIKVLRLRTLTPPDETTTHRSDYTDNFPITESHIRHLNLLLERLDQQQIPVEPLDAATMELLQIARSDELRERWLLDSGKNI